MHIADIYLSFTCFIGVGCSASVTSNILSSFSSHISWKHKFYSVNDFRLSITSPTTPTDLSEKDEELPMQYNDPQPTVGCSEIESSSYLEPVDNCTI